MMFTPGDWQDTTRKRTREDEYEDIVTGGTLGFTEHRSKRIQALPLRISDSSKKWPGPPTFASNQQSLPRTITPTDSDSEDAGNTAFRYNSQQTQQQQQEQQQEQQQQQQQGLDGARTWADANMMECALPSFCMEPELSPGEDFDMMMDSPEPEVCMATRHQEQPDGHGLLQVNPFQSEPVTPSPIAERMPTPLHPSFAAQVRGGKNWGGAAGNIMGEPQPYCGIQIESTGLQPLTSITESPTRPRAGATSGPHPVIGDWNLVHNRRLPSPISEGGGEWDDMRDSPAMVMDFASPGPTDTLAGNPPFSSHLPRASSAAALGGTQVAVDVPQRAETPHIVSPEPQNGDGSMDVEATMPSPPRKGHSRSKHTVNSWTQQPGMKKSFSIGYRADCEKCRLKVPGHFNHIVIS